MFCTEIYEEHKIKLVTRLLALYLLLAPLDFITIIPGISIMKILSIIPLFSCLLYINNMKIKVDKLTFIPIVYFLIIMTTALYTSDYVKTQGRILSIGLNILLILSMSMIRYNKNEVKYIRESMVYSGWITLILMMIYSRNDIISGRYTISVNGVYQDPNYLVGFFIFSIVYYYEQFLKGRSINSVIKLGVFLLAIVLTGSRGGLITIVFCLLGYTILWIKANKVKASTIFWAIFTIIIMCCLYSVVLDMLPDTIASRYSLEFTINDGGAGRFGLWTSALNNYNNSTIFYKFFGHGAATISHFTFDGNVVHNIWIEALIEIGIIGVFILFIFYYTFIKKAYKMGEYVICIVFIGYMIMALSLSLYSYKPIWNIILLISIIRNSYKAKID